MVELALLLAAASESPVSYSRQIAPILAFHCNHCHGGPGTTAAGGFSTYTYAGLRAGGNLGPAVAPGDPDTSLLIAFLEGRRGEARRMPLNAPPLAPEQIALIRRWIAEGVCQDRDATPRYTLTLAGLRRGALEITARVPTRAYLTLALHDENGARTLFERAEPAAPETALSWTVQPGQDWPRRLVARLTIAYAEPEPLGAALSVSGSGSLRAGAEGLEIELAERADVTVKCVPEGSARAVYSRRLRLPAGPSRQSWGFPLPSGLYTARVRYGSHAMAVLFRSR